MTPTPEDIALADEINAAFWSSATPMTEELQARLIAAHTAPLRELAEIGRLYCEHRKAAHDYDICDCDHAATLEAHALRYDRSFDALRDAHSAYLAKHPTEKP